MRKHLTVAFTTVCFVIGIYAGDKARSVFMKRKYS
jgi:hypothetical protein